MNRENVPFYIGLAAVAAIGVLLFSLPARSEEVEMEVKVAQGVTERTHHITDPEGTYMQCVVLGPLIAQKWVAENLAGQWVILRITCGPPRRDM